MPQAILGDKVVSPSELNRRSGAILKMAARRPVTVKTRSGDLVILKRAQASKLFEQQAHLGTFEEVMANIMERCFKKSNVPRTPAFRWMHAFDEEELLEFTCEYLEAISAAIEGRAEWAAADDVIYEWRGSALALQNPELQEAI